MEAGGRRRKERRVCVMKDKGKSMEGRREDWARLVCCLDLGDKDRKTWVTGMC